MMAGDYGDNFHGPVWDRTDIVPPVCGLKWQALHSYKSLIFVPGTGSVDLSITMDADDQGRVIFAELDQHDLIVRASLAVRVESTGSASGTYRLQRGVKYIAVQYHFQERGTSCEKLITTFNGVSLSQALKAIDPGASLSASYN